MRLTRSTSIPLTGGCPGIDTLSDTADTVEVSNPAPGADGDSPCGLAPEDSPW